MNRGTITVATALLAAGALAGCGGGSSKQNAAPAATSSAAPSPTPKAASATPAVDAVGAVRERFRACLEDLGLKVADGLVVRTSDKVYVVNYLQPTLNFIVTVDSGGGVAASNNSMTSATLSTVGCAADGSSITPSEEPTSEPTSAPSSTYSPGQGANLSLVTTNRLDGSKTEVEVTITMNNVSTATTGSYQGPQNGLFVIVPINYKVTSGSIDYNPYNFQLQAPDGSVYQANSGNSYDANADPKLESGNLSEGQQVTGNVVFDAPDAAAHGKILYKPRTEAFATWDY